MKKTKLRIAMGGSAANPPHLGHLFLISALLHSGQFDRVIWVPSGDRQKKALVDPNHRAAMTMLTFPRRWLCRRKPEFIIDFSDVYGKNTPTIEWLLRLQKENPEAEIVWYTGADSVVPQEKYGGKCEIEAEWFRGAELMQKYNFCILPRPNYTHPSKLSLPPQFRVLECAMQEVSSTDIVRRIASGKEFEHLVAPDVARYIKQFQLYGWRKEKGK